MPGASFSHDQIITLLQFIREKNFYKDIDGRRKRNDEVFEKLAKYLNERYPSNQKTGQQVRVKWKSMRAKYVEEKNNCAKSGELEKPDLIIPAVK